MIAEALRLLRVFHKISQADLASSFGMSKSYLSEIESGKKKLTLEVLTKYSTHFRVPLSTLFLFSEELDRTRLSDRIRGTLAIKALQALGKIESVAEEVGDGQAVPD